MIKVDIFLASDKALGFWEGENEFRKATYLIFFSDHSSPCRLKVDKVSILYDNRLRLSLNSEARHRMQRMKAENYYFLDPQGCY